MDKCFSSRHIIFLISLLHLNFIVLSFGCSHKEKYSDLQIPENIREMHAKELLTENFNKIDFTSFKGDKEFALYVKTYLEKENIKLGSDKFIKAVFTESKLYGYDPIFLIAVIKTESQFNDKAIGAAGEIGLMQIKPETAEWVCKKYGVKWLGAQALTDPEYNVKVSALYFKYLKKTLNSKSKKYVNAYNLGVNKLARLPVSYVAVHSYYHKVIKNYTQIYNDLVIIKTNMLSQSTRT